MDKDILALISRDNSGFSKGQRLIAKYILENYDKAAFMTAGKLGKTVGVSESTVVRFAAELGYDGYPGMRKALQEMIRSRLTSVQRIEAAKDLIDDRNILKAVLSDDIDKLQATLEEIDQESFDRAIDLIMSAKNIYIFASRTSQSLSNFMAFYLNMLRDGVHLVQDNTAAEAYEQLIRIGGGDLFVGFTFPRYSSRSLKVMRFAKDRGAAALALTDSESSPLYGVADVCLFAKSEMVSFVDSLVAPLSLVNAIVIAVAARSRDQLAETFKDLENVWSEYKVFEKIEADAVVIGGGAAGTLCAALAAGRGLDVVLLEPNRMLGRKLRITGKGRCNVTNDCDAREFISAIPGDGRFLQSAIHKFGTSDTKALFEGLALPENRARQQGLS